MAAVRPSLVNPEEHVQNGVAMIRIREINWQTLTQNCFGQCGRGFLLCLALLSGGPQAAQAQQPYPNRQIQLVVPLGPGGINDIVSRLISQKMSEDWGQPVIVLNKPGGGGIIGSEFVARAKPDGYTILMVYSSHAVNPSLYSKLPYDTLADFQPITMVNTVNLVLTIGPSTKANSVADLIAMAKAQPDAINYGTVGTGSLGHLAGLLFAKTADIRITQLSYKGAPEVSIALMRGDATMYFDSLITALPFIKDGRVKALAVTSPTRSLALPDTPTMAEAGVGFQMLGWNGIVAPAGTPEPIVKKLNAEIVHILHLPEIEKMLSEEGVDVVGDTPEHFREVIRTDVERWRTIVKDAGIKIN
jgi:tripartite-type tricarboxylate transporter receptor subunit TctC